MDLSAAGNAMMDPQEGGAAIVRREESREADGRFGVQDHAAPIAVIAGGVVSEYVDPVKGSFQYPDVNGFDGSLDEHLEFFFKTPLPEPLLQAADKAYEERRLEEIEWAGNRAAKAVSDDPAAVELIARANRETHTGADTYSRLAEEARKRGEREEAARWRFTNIAPVAIRSVVKAAQAYRLRSMLGSEIDKQRLAEHVVAIGSKRYTVKEIWDDYRCDLWIHDAL